MKIQKQVNSDFLRIYTGRYLENTVTLITEYENCEI